jgi:hypothetical protein
MEEMQLRDRLDKLALPAWELLPDFGLYMDQLVTYVERCFAGDACFALTPAMINNYVKGGLIDRPKDKKYSRESLAQLLMVCHLKQTSSMDTMKRLLHPESDETTEAIYARFAQTQARVLQSFSELPTADPIACALEAATCQTLCRILLEEA